MDELELLGDEYCIGEFGDKRLCRSGKLLYKRMLERGTVCIRQLCDERAEQKRFNRLLEHPDVTHQEIIRYGGMKIASMVTGRHVLAIQDTSELDYTAHLRRTQGLGRITNHKGAGLFIHPVLVVDAHNQHCLGIAHQESWIREEAASPKNSRRPIEEKESYRWLQAIQKSEPYLEQAAQVTVIADRESDLYEEWDRIPSERIHLLIRSNSDRRLADGGTLSQWVSKQPAVASFMLEVPARKAGRAYKSTKGAGSKSRTHHRAHMELRFGRVHIARPEHCKAKQESIELTVVDVTELPDTVEPGEEPVHWRLLSTHLVDDVPSALQLVTWYRQRWQIEQLFRTLKRQGLDIEASQLEDAHALLKLASLAVLVAARTLQLVNARDGQTTQPAADAFDNDEIDLIEKLHVKFEGKTPKQKNPYLAKTMAWASWLIARLGGWMGYSSEAKPGPITMLHGLQRFDSMVLGWRLANFQACKLPGIE
jgi:hypothetical protein